MNKLDTIKRKIKYRSEYRGIKEMDLLLGKFVNKYIDSFDEKELKLLESLLSIDDDILSNWYFGKNLNNLVPNNSVSEKLKKFKL